MAQVGKTAAKGGGQQQVFRPVLQGGDTGGPDVWVVVLGAAGRDDEGVLGHLLGAPPSDHGEAGKAEG